MHEIKRIKCGNGNCYIVRSGESAVLVDTCRKQFRERILSECGMLNIRLIVLTHGHLDHVQNAAWLSHRLNAPVAMSRADAPRKDCPCRLGQRAPLHENPGVFPASLA